MTKVWRFKFDRDGEELQCTHHETEEAAYRGAVEFIIGDMLEELDLGDDDHRDIIRQVLAHAEAGDCESAFKAYVSASSDGEWNETATVESIPLIAGFDIGVVARVQEGRKALRDADKTADDEDEDEADEEEAAPPA